MLEDAISQDDITRDMVEEKRRLMTSAQEMHERVLQFYQVADTTYFEANRSYIDVLTGYLRYPIYSPFREQAPEILEYAENHNLNPIWFARKLHIIARDITSDLSYWQSHIEGQPQQNVDPSFISYSQAMHEAIRYGAGGIKFNKLIQDAAKNARVEEFQKGKERGEYRMSSVYEWFLTHQMDFESLRQNHQIIALMQREEDHNYH